VELLAAQVAGQVPVVLPDGTGPGHARRLLAAAGREGVRRGLPAGTPLLVVGTSGSGGRPRAVVRTVASWAASLPGYTWLAGGLAGGDDPGPGWAPGGTSSTLTLFALWHALATGIPVLATGRWRGAGAAAVAAAGARVVHAVPPIAADVLAARRAGALPGLRRMVVAGAAVPPRLRAAADSVDVELAEYYGAAELSFVAADPNGGGLRPFPGAQVRVRDGHVEVRSPYLALGYLPGTAGPLRTAPDGWAGVGDRGRLDPDGVLTVGGRDEAAGVAGVVVLLADVEAALAEVPGVAEVACFAEPHERLGERVVAVVRPSDAGADDVVARLRRHARAALPPPARPARYVVVDDLPRTAGGKVARAQLRAALPGAALT
jgi:long-chain acyl-CoA synthetase